MWVIDARLRLRIGREPAKQSESSEQQHASSDIFESQGSLIERSEQSAARIDEPIGFRPAPEDARRSSTSTQQQPGVR